MPPCSICTYLENEADRIATTAHWVVALAPDQGYLGRCYVTLREHKSSLADLSDQEWADYAQIVRLLEHAVTKAFGASPYNWACMMNNAYRESPVDPHVHWHFRPRYPKPVVVNGVTFSDPRYGNHYDPDQRKQVDDETFQTVLESLRTIFAKES